MTVSTYHFQLLEHFCVSINKVLIEDHFLFAFRLTFELDLLLNCLCNDTIHFALGLIVFFSKMLFLIFKKCVFVQEMVKEKVLCWKYFPNCVLSMTST